VRTCPNLFQGLKSDILPSGFTIKALYIHSWNVSCMRIRGPPDAAGFRPPSYALQVIIRTRLKCQGMIIRLLGC
jgi:hypothetical protein